MELKSVFKRPVILYLVKFTGAFCFFYFGTLAVIGLSAPGGYYSGFVARYLNFIPPWREFILYMSAVVLDGLGYEAYQQGSTHLYLVGGGGVNLVYSCLGYGVTSFWLAFVFANSGSVGRKLAWMLGGTLLLLVTNILRISLVALASHNHWAYPLGWDHHTWFTIAAYGVIFLMIWVYDKSG